MVSMLAEHKGSTGMPADNLHLSPVDLKHLRRYTLGDQSLEREVLSLFLAQLPSTISALGAARTDKDWKVAAHTLKGSGRAVGAWRIARIAEQAEHSGAKDAAHIANTLELLNTAAREAQDFIARVYGEEK